MTEKQVKDTLKEHNKKWKDFTHWMNGQTMGLNEDGTTDFYECDVDRFIRNLKNND